MQIAVIGAGAIGCLVGGKLAQQGHAVTLVGRPRFAETVQQAGLTIVDDGRPPHRPQRDGRGRHGRGLGRGRSVPIDAAILTVQATTAPSHGAGRTQRRWAGRTAPCPLGSSASRTAWATKAIAARFDAAHTVRPAR
ncbi:MAG: 2-dehydropantoate 2-reductase N-terminal domain-containing protein [Caldilineaceae bacterium]